MIREVNVKFIIPQSCEDETKTSTAMQEAYSACKQNIIKVNWVRECNGECINLQKTDFLVFQEFSGELYQKALASKSVILGPWCLLVCLSEVKPIPNVDWPVMNMAMENCVIVCSNLSKLQKKDIRMKVQTMGGHFTTTLFSSNTHLVTDTVHSEKYYKAATLGVKIMLPSWIDRVWEASLQEMVHANDERFSKYKCLPFHNLTICTAGFGVDEINQLKQLISENGGKFRKHLVLKNTDVLVCNGSSSKKYKAARKHNIVCVSIGWVIDSVSKGYRIPDTDTYPVKKTTSTPKKGATQKDPNFSMMSAKGGTPLSSCSVLQDSIIVTKPFTTPFPQTVMTKRKSSSEYAELVDGIDIRSIKKAEFILDGYSVYLVGFSAEHHKKLCKVLNFTLATRLNTLSKRITHIIVGDSSCNEVKIIRSKNMHCPMVTVKWLVDSIEKRQPVPEEDYLISSSSSPSPDYKSPLIKKGLRLLKTDVSIMETDPPPKAPVVTTSPLQEEHNRDDDMTKSTTNNEDSLAAVLAMNQFDTKRHITTNKTNQTKKPPNSFRLNISVNKGLKSLSINGKCLDTTKGENTPNGNKKVSTPSHKKILEKEYRSGCNTPANNVSTYCSEITPVNQIMQNARIDLDMETPETPKSWDHIDSPNSSLAAAFCVGTPTTEVRKDMLRWSNESPDYKEKPRQLSTPLSELKRCPWYPICPDSPEVCNCSTLSTESAFAEPHKSVSKTEDSFDSAWLGEKLNQLESMLKASASSRQRSSVKRVHSVVAEDYSNSDKVSQPICVEWDENINSNKAVKKHGLFMISEERERLVKSLEMLGANLSNLQNDDPASTYLICPRLTESLFEESHKSDSRGISKTEDSSDIALLGEKLKQLESMLKNSASSSQRSSVKRVPSVVAEDYTSDKVSQSFCIGWDENIDSNKAVKKPKKPGLFMISGVDSEEHDRLVKSLEMLGANVSNLENYDSASTHLICQKLNRNEKLLASMAAGKWILHISYVEDSVAAGKLLNEEDYEFGNPKSAERIKIEKSDKRARCVYSWRKEISKRGYGAFQHIRGIVVAKHREPMIRVIEAGGGIVIDASPPFEDKIFATHCFLELKMVSDFKDYIPLAQQGIYCLNTCYVNHFLHKAVKDIRDFIVPSFHKYYS